MLLICESIIYIIAFVVVFIFCKKAKIKKFIQKGGMRDAMHPDDAHRRPFRPQSQPHSSADHSIMRSYQEQTQPPSGYRSQPPRSRRSSPPTPPSPPGTGPKPQSPSIEATASGSHPPPPLKHQKAAGECDRVKDCLSPPPIKFSALSFKQKIKKAYCINPLANVLPALQERLEDKLGDMEFSKRGCPIYILFICVFLFQFIYSIILIKKQCPSIKSATFGQKFKLIYFPSFLHGLGVVVACNVGIILVCIPKLGDLISHPFIELKKSDAKGFRWAFIFMGLLAAATAAVYFWSRMKLNSCINTAPIPTSGEEVIKQWNTIEAQYYLNTRNELDNLPPEQLSEDQIDRDINTFKSFS